MEKSESGCHKRNNSSRWRRERKRSEGDVEQSLDPLRSPLRMGKNRIVSERKHRTQMSRGPLANRQHSESVPSKMKFRHNQDLEKPRTVSGATDLASLVEEKPRTFSGATDWASLVEEDERNKVHERSFRKRLELGQQQQPKELQFDTNLSHPEDEDEEKVEYPDAMETDAKILERRQKQINYGLGTSEYDNYCKQVPLQQRTKLHPWTPDKTLKYSRRGWDTVIRIWRKQLHIWDPQSNDLCPPSHLLMGQTNDMAAESSFHVIRPESANGTEDMPTEGAISSP